MKTETCPLTNKTFTVLNCNAIISIGDHCTAAEHEEGRGIVRIDDSSSVIGRKVGSFQDALRFLRPIV